MSAHDAIEHFSRLGNDVIQMYLLRMIRLHSTEGQELAGKAGGRLTGLLDLLRILSSRSVELAYQYAAVAIDRGQQVVEVMGDAARQASDGLHLVGLIQLRFQFCFLVRGSLAPRDIARDGL